MHSQRAARSTRTLDLKRAQPPTPASETAVDAPSRPARILALQRTVGNSTVERLLKGSRVIARQPAVAAPAKTTVTVTVTWNTSKPPRRYLDKVLQDHPAEWTADVMVDGKVVKTDDGSTTLELAAGKAHWIKVIPKAKAPANYFTPGKAKWKQGSALSVKLGYNRENRRFSEQSWAQKGLDTTKVGKVQTVPMLGHDVTVNLLVLPTVNRTNGAFKKLDPKTRAEVTKSIWSIGGYNVRTTSKGGFSNHSTGCAVDINPLNETTQNWHVQKSDPVHRRQMALFQKVVRLDPAFKDYDVWSQKNPDKILEASRQFNERLPRYLFDLLDDAFGDASMPSKLAQAISEYVPFAEVATLKNVLKTLLVGPELVQVVDPKLLEEAAKAAEAAKKGTTALALRAIATDWKVVRAWVEGVVTWKNKKGDREWAYASDYKQDHPGSDPVVTQGMVSLHPKLVSTMIEGGWSWLVDYKSDAEKDFMHFEDRVAENALKK